MKTRIPVCVVLALAFISTAAYGQYRQPVPQPVENLRGPIVHPRIAQAPGCQAPSCQAPGCLVQACPQPVMQNNYTPVVADACDCGSDCNVQCGAGQCGSGECGSGRCSSGGCGGRLRSFDGLRGALQSYGGHTGAYDPCCPTKYYSIFGGAATFNDIGFDLELTDPGNNTTDLSAILEQNNGWTIGGAMGRSIGKRLRGELELSYRNATLNQADIVVNGSSLANASLDGQLNIYRSMSNLLFNLNPNGRFNAYFGGGVGVGFIDLDATEPTTPITARLQTSTWVYQGIVGISGKVNPRAEVFVDYRYFGTDHVKFDAASPIGTANLNIDITSNDIFFGIRVKR